MYKKLDMASTHPFFYGVIHLVQMWVAIRHNVILCILELCIDPRRTVCRAQSVSVGKRYKSSSFACPKSHALEFLLGLVSTII